MGKKPESTGTPVKSDTDAHPTKWWQWILVYPGIALGVVGAIPTAIEAASSFAHGVPFGSSYDAKKQNALWVANSDCLKDAAFTPVRTKSNVEIATLVCTSGDVLLVGKRPEWAQPQKRWVAWNEIASDGSSARTSAAVLSFLMSSANANELAGIQLAQLPPMRMMCQRWVGNGLLLQRIATPQGCYDQVVNTYNGWVVSTQPAPCTPQC